jgi:hypothetical protein
MSKRLTLEQHKELGTKLRIARNDLLDTVVLLSNTYGKTNKHRRAAENALLLIDSLRCELDDLIFDEHAEKTTRELASVYYGKNLQTVS